MQKRATYLLFLLTIFFSFLGCSTKIDSKYFGTYTNGNSDLAIQIYGDGKSCFVIAIQGNLESPIAYNCHMESSTLVMTINKEFDDYKDPKKRNLIKIPELKADSIYLTINNTNDVLIAETGMRFTKKGTVGSNQVNSQPLESNSNQFTNSTSNVNLVIREETVPEIPLSYEAQEFVEKFVKKHTAKCGEIYYLRSDDNLYACKNPYEVIVEGRQFSSKTLSEADRLNGVDPLPKEWEGIFTINMNLCRMLSLGPASNNAWSAWNDSNSHKPKIIKKVKGKWEIENVSNFREGGRIMDIRHKCSNGSGIELLDNKKNS